MDFLAWWQRWFARHPLKSPESLDRSAYTAQVMTRVRQAAYPAPSAFAIRPGRLWPQLGLALATAAAGIFVVLHHGQPSVGRLARQIERDTALLAAVDEPLTEPVSTGDPEELVDELELVETFTLAEAPQSDEAWIQDTVQLLNQLDEELPANAAGEETTGPSDDDWMQELQTLDESDLAASS